MSRLLLIVFYSFTIFFSGVMANERGTLSVFLLSDGTPLSSNEVRIDGVNRYFTDSDGLVQQELKVGKHLVEIFAKTLSGKNLGYVKKRVVVKEKRDTQIISSFLPTKRSANVDVDTPIGKNVEVQTKVEVSKGKGVLRGVVLSSQGKKPIGGARVFVRGTSVDVRTDSNGRFSAEVPSGISLAISVVHSAYSASTVSGIRVKTNGVTHKKVVLTPASMELEEFVVLAPKVEGSITDVVLEEKKSTAITNIIGSESFSKKGDGSAASALKRVTGVTLIGGKSIFVRGLGERYSNIELNSMPLASPDPTKRVVPLDIFPSSMIGSMKVQKSGTADIPASFGGGYIDIRSKDSKEEDYIKIGLGLNANSNTGKKIISYQGSPTDFLGYDDGYRDIPQVILNQASVKVSQRVGRFSTRDFTKDELVKLTKDFVKRDMAIKKTSLPVGGGFGVEGIKNFEIDDEQKISVFASYNYGQNHNYIQEKFFTYSYNSDKEKILQPTSDGVQEKASSSYSHSAMLNVNYSYLDLLKLKYTKLFTHTAQQRTRVTEGVFGSNNEHLIFNYLDWEERTLSTDQLSGNFDYELFDKKNSLNFGVEYVQAKLNQPNNFFYADKILDNGQKLINATSTNMLSRKLNSNDDVFAFYLKNKTYYEIFGDKDYVEAGVSYSAKSRKSEYQKFYLKNSGAEVDQLNIRGGDIEGVLDQYVRENKKYDKRAFLISALFSPADYFDASVDEADFYANVFTQPNEQFDVVMGMRYVNLTQTISQYKEDNKKNIIKEDESLDIGDFYPSLSVKYKYNDNNHFDFALSRTFIVPDLREFSSGVYFHPYDVATVHGNPDLVNTDIYSLDFKYSHYFNDSQYIKSGLFYKYLDKPIEDTQIESSSLPIYSYINSDFATLYGVEVDARSSLDFAHKSLSNLFVSSNFSYTNSNVTLKNEQKNILTSNNRQLQGLSQLIFNASLSYEIKPRTLTLSFNKMGERIRKVGLINSLGVHYEDSIETPPNLLDFVWIENLDDDLKLNFKLGNILDDKTVWKQGKSITKEFETKRTVNFSLSYKF